MRQHMIWVSATLALAVGGLSGCSSGAATSSASPAASCVNQGAPHHAYVVVEHGSHTVVQRCVGFQGENLSAQNLMDQSGIEYQTQSFSFGKAVCQVDHEPARFTKCFADSGPNWALFVETGGQWTQAQTGYTEVTLHDKDALGWIYTADVSPSPPLPAKE